MSTHCGRCGAPSHDEQAKLDAALRAEVTQLRAQLTNEKAKVRDLTRIDRENAVELTALRAQVEEFVEALRTLEAIGPSGFNVNGTAWQAVEKLLAKHTKGTR